MKASIQVKRDKLYVVIAYQDEFNQSKQKWFGTGLDDTKKNRKKAEEIKEEKLKEYQNNYRYLERGSNKILFADYLEQWLERTKPNLQISTYSTYAQQIEKIAKYFRDRQISLIDLQPLDIANFYSNLQKSGKSVQLCEHYHVNIRKALQSALKAGLVPFNPADRIDRPKSPKHVAKYYNRQQLDRLFACLEDDDYAYIYKMTAYYGLRRSEMMGIKWSNIDFENNMIVLNHTVIQTRLNGKSIIVAKDRMKNSSSLRSLPLLPAVKKLLLELKEKQEENKILYKDQYEYKYKDYICVDDLGYRRNPDTVSAHFKLVLKHNNLPIIKYHELRHSCASLLLEEGVSMKEIQEWLGHSTYNTTADIYSHLDYSSKKKVGKVMNAIFEEQEGERLFEEIQEENQERNEEIDTPKPRHLNSYKHRDNTRTRDIEMEQTIPNIDEELEELDRLIKMKEALLLKKKKDSEMC